VYRHILSLLSEYFGGKSQFVFMAGLVLLALAVILLLLPPWRKAVRAAWEKGGWRGIVLGAVHGLLNVLVGSTLIGGLGGAMLVQSGLFDEQHGQVTQENYDAIKTNWGSPHEQRELAVTHFITEEQTVLLFKDGRQVTEEELGAGKVKPPAPKPDDAAAAEEEGKDEGKGGGENPIKIKRKVRKPVPQNSIVRGKVDVDVKMNYRPKGSAYYTCYEDTWKLDYTVKNRSDKATEAEFRFPMPADRGTYNQFAILVDGKNWVENLILKDNAQTWKMPMAPGQTVNVQVTYASRGMEYLRYTPASMAHREDYKVTMRIHPHAKQGDESAQGEQRFIWKKHMALPIGSMTPPVIKDSAADGEPMTLEWDMASSATSLGMGVILPGIKQPGYYVTRLLHEAPLGLMLLAGSLLVTWMLLGRETDLFSLGLLAVAYYLFYTFVAYLSYHLSSFDACFSIAAAATLLLVVLYLEMGWGRTFASFQSIALVFAFVVYYPLAVVEDKYTGLLVQILYWGLALYIAMLAVARIWAARREGREA
jgi:hypothetical protein